MKKYRDYNIYLIEQTKGYQYEIVKDEETITIGHIKTKNKEEILKQAKNMIDIIEDTPLNHLCSEWLDFYFSNFDIEKYGVFHLLQEHEVGKQFLFVYCPFCGKEFEENFNE